MDQVRPPGRCRSRPEAPRRRSTCSGTASKSGGHSFIRPGATDAQSMGKGGTVSGIPVEVTNPRVRPVPVNVVGGLPAPPSAVVVTINPEQFGQMLHVGDALVAQLEA